MILQSKTGRVVAKLHQSVVLSCITTCESMSAIGALQRATRGPNRLILLCFRWFWCFWQIRDPFFGLPYGCSKQLLPHQKWSDSKKSICFEKQRVCSLKKTEKEMPGKRFSTRNLRMRFSVSVFPRGPCTSCPGSVTYGHFYFCKYFYQTAGRYELFENIRN